MPRNSSGKKKLSYPSKGKVVQIDVKEDEDEKEKRQFVIFRLASEEYGLDILQAREILRMVPITPIPGSPDFIRGVINLRGKIIVVIDLERQIRIEQRDETGETRIIVAETGGKQVGLVVDSVSDMLQIPVEAIKPPPGTLKKKVELDYLEGVGMVGKRLLLILDLDSLLASGGMKHIDEIHKRYGSR